MINTSNLNDDPTTINTLDLYSTPFLPIEYNYGKYTIKYTYRSKGASRKAGILKMNNLMGYVDDDELHFRLEKLKWFSNN